jgi:hypothetical protein
MNEDAFGVEKGWRDPKLKNTSALPERGSSYYKTTKNPQLEYTFTRKKNSLILRRPRYEATLGVRGYTGPTEKSKFKNKTSKEGAKIMHGIWQKAPGKRPKTGTKGLPVRYVDEKGTK